MLVSRGSDDLPRLHAEPRQTGRLRRQQRRLRADRPTFEDVWLRISTQRRSLPTDPTCPVRTNDDRAIRLHRDLGSAQQMESPLQHRTLRGHGLRMSPLPPPLYSVTDQTLEILRSIVT